jgi:hypothetical protein
MAMTYNDKSVNEMMHVSLAFKLAVEDPSLNVFAKFSEQEYELVSDCRRGVVSFFGGGAAALEDPIVQQRSVVRSTSPQANAGFAAQLLGGWVVGALSGTVCWIAAL